ncbi:hypothetical protein OA343_02890 [Paracoccaceae bacterium]|nr:hypothetical protein [Paracoccaceae bacterium]
MPANTQSAQLNEILNYLCERDEKIHSIVDTVTLPVARDINEGFSLLVKTIVSQQLSSKAAETIFQRFLNKHGLEFGFQPVDLLGTQETIRACGISNSKSSFILSIRDELIAKKSFFLSLSFLDDEEVEKKLTKLKGVGTWTARILMISLYGRLDVFPYNDGTLVTALSLMGYKNGSIDEIAAVWAPYRSVAARLLWNAYDKGWLSSN